MTRRGLFATFAAAMAGQTVARRPDPYDAWEVVNELYDEFGFLRDLLKLRSFYIRALTEARLCHPPMYIVTVSPEGDRQLHPYPLHDPSYAAIEAGLAQVNSDIEREWARLLGYNVTYGTGYWGRVTT